MCFYLSHNHSRESFLYWQKPPCHNHPWPLSIFLCILRTQCQPNTGATFVSEAINHLCLYCTHRRHTVDKKRRQIKIENRDHKHLCAYQVITCTVLVHVLYLLVLFLLVLAAPPGQRYPRSRKIKSSTQRSPPPVPRILSLRSDTGTRCIM